MKLKLVLVISIAAVALPASVANAQPVAATVAQSAHDQLFKVFKDSDEASLKRNPLTISAIASPTDIMPASAPRPKRTWRRFMRSTGRSSMPLTKSLTTCSNFQPRTLCAGFSRTCWR